VRAERLLRNATTH